MEYLVCTNQTGAILEDLTSRNIPPDGEERTGILWTSELGKLLQTIWKCCVWIYM